MKSIKLFETTDEIAIKELEGDYCLLDFKSENGPDKIVLSYDAAYDLALRLSYFIQRVDAREAESTELIDEDDLLDGSLALH